VPNDNININFKNKKKKTNNYNTLLQDSPKLLEEPENLSRHPSFNNHYYNSKGANQGR